MNLTNAKTALAALKSTGLVNPVLSFALAQAAFESSGFTSHVFDTANNASGIKWDGQDNATDSTITASDGGTFAAYPGGINDWATDFVRVLNLQRPNNTIGAPSGANDLQGYVSRLQANNYFGAGSATDYYNGLNSELKALSSVLSETDAYNEATDNTGRTILERVKSIGQSVAAASQDNALIFGISSGIVLICVLILLFVNNRKKKKNA